MITGIHHIALLISSEETLDFYKTLGFIETYRLKRKFDTVVLLYGYNLNLEVFIDSRHPKQEVGLNERLGVRHFSLRVDDIEKTVEELNIINTKIEKDWLGIKYCFFYDPDGNLVELHE